MKIRANLQNASCDPELLSGLVDGELDRESAERLIAAICLDADARRRWIEMHLIGDALHSSDVAACHAEAFCARVSAALSNEPTILAPRSQERSPAWRRYALPGLAVAASAAVISFIAVPLMRDSTPGVGPGQVAATTAAPVVSEDARRAAATVASARALDPYLLAHRELTGGVTLPRAAPYLRSVLDQPEGR